MYYKKLNRNIQCTLCPHECILHEANIGLCGVRQNIGGKVRCRAYGKLSACALDPIEKKPFYHFYPGTHILSLGSFGCNLKCNFCQNWQISQACKIDDLPIESTSVDSIINDALTRSNNIGIAYTYNEPTVWFEFVHEIALAAKSNNLKNVVVSNGYINTEPLNDLIEVTDAFNIDLKAFTNGFYNEMTGGSIEHVLQTLKTIKESGKHLEISNLVIPRKNDDLEVFKEMIDWINIELGNDTVLHLSRYFPNYKQTLPLTSENTLIEMYNIARNKLNYVYIGNIRTANYSSTNCKQCGTLLVQRKGYNIEYSTFYKNGSCLNCHQKVAID